MASAGGGQLQRKYGKSFRVLSDNLINRNLFADLGPIRKGPVNPKEFTHQFFDIKKMIGNDEVVFGKTNLFLPAVKAWKA